MEDSSMSPDSIWSLPLLAFTISLLSLHVHRLDSVSFKVIGPDRPIRALVGEDALLPCHLSPSMSAQSMEVRWFRSTLSAVVHLYRDGRDQVGQQIAPYRNRTKLLKDGIVNGTVSLRIHNITPSDEGTYGCLFQSPTFYEEAALELEVAGLGSTPHLSVNGYQDGGIHVVCESAGWYPKPQVLWRDLSGQRLAPVMEKISQQADRLFDTHTAAVIRDASNQNLSCSVLNPRLGQERTATMHIAGPGPAFGKMAPWVTLYFGTLAPMDAVTPIAPTPVAALPLPLAFTGSPGSPQPQGPTASSQCLICIERGSGAQSVALAGQPESGGCWLGCQF